MPLAVEPIPPKWTFGIISGMFTLAIDAFERVRAWFSSFNFESGGFVLKFALQHHARSL